ncbi:hypothetical protein QN277_022852 [Acacia crassicarpa]|uniref:Uncharacterized protein n=1 Tax=Acacia crassicarpa TaxID=499986 RepID=A0AAE1KAH9_9FABA|nr:hypothetical protein QN277_022852 [Acacia crassicarpa]
MQIVFQLARAELKEKVSSNKREEIKEGTALVFEGGLREEIEEESSAEIAEYWKLLWETRTCRLCNACVIIQISLL